MLKFVPLIRKSLFRNLRRTILTTASIAMSLFLLGILFAVYASFFHAEVSDEQSRRLITRHKVSLTQSMPAYYQQKIGEIEGVEQVIGQNWFGGVYKDNKPEEFFSRFATDPERIFNVYSEFKVPPDQLEAFVKDRQGLAVGSATAERVGLKLGDRITVKGDIFPNDLELTVRAIFVGPADDVTYFHRKYLDEGLPDGFADTVGFYSIRVNDPAEIQQVAARVDELFRNAPSPTKTETESAFQLAFVNQIGNIKLFLLAISGAIVFTIMLVSANTMAMSVRERIREVGVLKTLGFTSSGVLALILSESLLLSLLGGALGVAAAWSAGSILKTMLAGFFAAFTMPWWGVPICLGVAVAIGLASSIVPAVSASHKQITEALRHTG